MRIVPPGIELAPPWPITPLRLELTDHQALERVRKLEAWKKLKFA